MGDSAGLQWFDWEHIRGNPPLRSWTAVRQRFQVDTILFSPARESQGYRVKPAGFPALLVLPKVWQYRLAEGD